MAKIYVACLASYNAGTLHGAWIDLEGKDSADVGAEIAAMLRASPFPNVRVKDPDTGKSVPSAEEWAIHDYESPVPLGEFAGIESALEAQKIEELANEFGEDVVSAALQCVDSDDSADDIREALSERYRGVYDTKADFAADLIDECGDLQNVPDSLARYFDYESYARDLELGGDVSFVRNSGGLHVFWNH